MVASIEMYDSRCRWWQPQILHIDNRLTVDGEVMATCHLLPYIQQQSVVARFVYVKRCLKDVPATHLFTTAFSGGDVDCFLSVG